MKHPSELKLEIVQQKSIRDPNAPVPWGRPFSRIVAVNTVHFIMLYEVRLSGMSLQINISQKLSKVTSNKKMALG